MPVPAKSRPKTRIQREKQDLILDAALNVFSLHGFRGATIDQIAEAAASYEMARERSLRKTYAYFSRKYPIPHMQ